MATVLQRRPSRQPTKNGAAEWQARLPRSRANPGASRRMLFAAISGLLVVVAAVVFASIYQRGSKTTSVLVVTKPLAPGATLEASDLAVASVRGTGFAALAVGAEDGVLRHQVWTYVAPGTLLAPSMLQPPAAPSHDQLVGIALRVGQYPGAGLVAGDRVAVIYASGSASAGGGSTAAAGGGTRGAAAALPSRGVDIATVTPGSTVLNHVVVADVTLATAGGAVIDVSVPSVDAAAIAQLSAENAIALALDPASTSHQAG
ncbi:MAG: SAF domain-containing protein [Actinomycetota bacterium]|nr:SAF domain-containing protein [Actinomycetota bacterium]